MSSWCILTEMLLTFLFWSPSLEVLLFFKGNFVVLHSARRMSAGLQSKAEPLRQGAQPAPAIPLHINTSQTGWKNDFPKKRIFCYLLHLMLFQIFFLPKAIQRLSENFNTAHESYGLLLLCFMPGNRFETSGRVNNQLRMNNEKKSGVGKDSILKKLILVLIKCDS